MKILFGQIYVQVGVTFPFSHHFQKYLSGAITELVTPSVTFTEKYGKDWDLILRISAKKEIKDTEIKGPTVFRKDKDVEFSIFLPFTALNMQSNPLRAALHSLLDGVSTVLTRLDISTVELDQRKLILIETICADSNMIE